MKAVILAAGKGTRMGELTRATPKPMLRVAGVPALERVIRGLQRAGLVQFVLVTGYLEGQIHEYFRSGDQLGCEIQYVHQETMNGTASALLLTRDAVGDSTFVLTFADILMDHSNYSGICDYHMANRCDVTAAVRRVEDPCNGAAVYMDADWNVNRIIEKPAPGTSTTPWNHSGMYCFSPAIYRYLEKVKPSARGEYEIPDAVRMMIDEGKCVRAYELGGYWSDLATPADIVEAERLITQKQTPR